MKKIKSALVLAVALVLMPATAYAATENDLREVMGLERIEGETWEKYAATILAQCKNQESYNELLDDLEFIDDEQAEIINEQVKQKEEYYVSYIKEFQEGATVDELMESFTGYNRMYKTLNQISIDPQIAGELEHYDTDAIERQAAYANIILSLCKSTKDIGKIGQEADTFLLTGLTIQDMSEDTLTCCVTPEDKIYAQFNGIVTKITEDTIEIRSGKETTFSYHGVKAKEKLSVGVTVKQYTYIGNPTGNTIAVSMKTGADAINPLKMYGEKARYWQNTYMRTMPWKSQCIDLDNIKNCVEEKTTDDSEHSTMTDEKGNCSDITENENIQNSDAETVLDDSSLNYFFKKNSN